MAMNTSLNTNECLGMQLERALAQFDERLHLFRIRRSITATGDMEGHHGYKEQGGASRL